MGLYTDLEVVFYSPCHRSLIYTFFFIHSDMTVNINELEKPQDL